MRDPRILQFILRVGGSAVLLVLGANIAGMHFPHYASYAVIGISLVVLLAAIVEECLKRKRRTEKEEKLSDRTTNSEQTEHVRK